MASLIYHKLFPLTNQGVFENQVKWELSVPIQALELMVASSSWWWLHAGAEPTLLLCKQ